MFLGIQEFVKSVSLSFLFVLTTPSINFSHRKSGIEVELLVKDGLVGGRLLVLKRACELAHVLLGAGHELVDVVVASLLHEGAAQAPHKPSAFINVPD